MDRLRQFKQWMKNAKGVATSLIEATATIAVGAVLAGVAVGGAIDAINDSKIQAAIADVSSIGQGVITFYKDNAFFPMFVDGNRTGTVDTAVAQLVSENGTFPTDSTALKGWGIPTGTPVAWGPGQSFGHMPDFHTTSTITSGQDTIEGQLQRNDLGNLEASITYPHYPLRGSYSGDPQRGWAGPYIGFLPKTDPWGNKYIMNIRNLNAKYLLSTVAAGSLLPKYAVVVLSSGPNRTIETDERQDSDNFIARGDDIVFKIR